MSFRAAASFMTMLACGLPALGAIGDLPVPPQVLRVLRISRTRREMVRGFSLRSRCRNLESSRAPAREAPASPVAAAELDRRDARRAAKLGHYDVSPTAAILDTSARAFDRPRACARTTRSADLQRLRSRCSSRSSKRSAGFAGCAEAAERPNNRRPQAARIPVAIPRPVLLDGHLRARRGDEETTSVLRERVETPYMAAMLDPRLPSVDPASRCRAPCSRCCRATRRSSGRCPTSSRRCS